MPSMHTLERLRWRCRRGMRELDLLLLNFVDRRGLTFDSAEAQAFQRLLELPDDVLLGLLMRRETTRDEGVTNIIDKIWASAARKT